MTTITRVYVKVVRFVSVLKVEGTGSVGALPVEVVPSSAPAVSGPRILFASAGSTQAFLVPRLSVLGRA